MANKNYKGKKVAIVHDFMFQYGGAEKVIEKLFILFPDADFYTAFKVPERFEKSKVLSRVLKENNVYTTAIQKIFNIKDKNGNRRFIKFQKHFFFIYPFLMKTLVVKNYDFVMITSTNCAKNITLKDNKKVVHCCHSPTRYLHGLTAETDKESLNIIFRLLIPLFILILKPLDLQAVKNLNKNGVYWVSNSEFIQRTVWEVYKTKSDILYPPVELQNFLKIKRKIPTKPEDQFFLSFGRISFHKRIDIAIKACLELKKNLVIGGTSPLERDLDYLKKIISDYKEKTGDNTEYVKFVGRIDDDEYFKYQSKATAFLFPGKEDFGITPVECLAAGLPVIAYAQGGALEYVKHKVNGVLFKDQTVEGMVNAIKEFEKLNLDIKKIKETSKAFGPEKFDEKVKSFVD